MTQLELNGKEMLKRLGWQGSQEEDTHPSPQLALPAQEGRPGAGPAWVSLSRQHQGLIFGWSLPSCVHCVGKMLRPDEIESVPQEALANLYFPPKALAKSNACLINTPQDQKHCTALASAPPPLPPLSNCFVFPS